MNALNTLHVDARRGALASLVSLALLAGCASTQLMDTWKDPAFSGPPMKRVVVIGALKSDVNRRVFEDAFATALNAAGTTAQPSYPTLPEGGAISAERVREAAKAMDADAVLVTRVLRVRQDVTVMPSYTAPGFYSAGFGGWYGPAYAQAPASVDVYDVLTVESTLWNVRTDKPVWSGTSEITAPGKVADASKELAGLLIRKMKGDGLI